MCSDPTEITKAAIVTKSVGRFDLTVEIFRPRPPPPPPPLINSALSPIMPKYYGSIISACINICYLSLNPSLAATTYAAAYRRLEKLISLRSTNILVIKPALMVSKGVACLLCRPPIGWLFDSVDILPT